MQPPRLSRSGLAGKTPSQTEGDRGPVLRTRGGPGGGISWAATLRAAAVRHGHQGSDASVVLRRDDLRFWERRGPAGRLLLFVVDASGSMAAWRRMRRTKAAILALLTQAYEQRDRVSLLTFRGVDTELLLPPTAGLARARQALDQLAVGGTTPLAAGLAAARRLIVRQQRRQPRLPVWAVVLTDGRANVALSGQTEPTAGTRPWLDALREARLLGGCEVDLLVIDTETGWPRFGRAAELAAALGGAYRPLDEVLGRPAGGHGDRSLTAGTSPAARHEMVCREVAS